MAPFLAWPVPTVTQGLTKTVAWEIRAKISGKNRQRNKQRPVWMYFGCRFVDEERQEMKNEIEFAVFIFRDCAMGAEQFSFRGAPKWSSQVELSPEMDGN